LTLYHFNELNENDKARATWEGVFLAHREDGVYRILLYQIDSFYVEVYYDKEKNVLIKFKSFLTTRLLDPYLDQIEIEGKF